MKLPTRKQARLKNYDYSTPGSYFITICTQDRKCLLSDIVGTDVLDGPKHVLSSYGKIADTCINQMDEFYDYISIDKYVIMPNHIHLLITIVSGGPPGTSVPTNSAVSQFISTFKRFSNKKYGQNIWQRSFHDHIIRDENDYKKIWEYIDTNPIKWEQDCFYTHKSTA